MELHIQFGIFSEVKRNVKRQCNAPDRIKHGTLYVRGIYDLVAAHLFLHHCHGSADGASGEGRKAKRSNDSRTTGRNVFLAANKSVELVFVENYYANV